MLKNKISRILKLPSWQHCQRLIYIPLYHYIPTYDCCLHATHARLFPATLLCRYVTSSAITSIMHRKPDEEIYIIFTCQVFSLFPRPFSPNDSMELCQHLLCSSSCRLVTTYNKGLFFLFLWINRFNFISVLNC